MWIICVRKLNDHLYLAHSKNVGGSPEDILLTARLLLANIALWALAARAVLLVFR